VGELARRFDGVLRNICYRQLLLCLAVPVHAGCGEVGLGITAEQTVRHELCRWHQGVLSIDRYGVVSF
jgi:hypothetical protein